MSPDKQASLLVVGAGGYLGSIICAGLLSSDKRRIVAPLRNGRSREELIAVVAAEAPQGTQGAIDYERLVTVDLPHPDAFKADRGSAFAEMLKPYDVEEIFHCAGSVDYFDMQQLQESNIDLTDNLLELGRKLAIQRFVFLSTAFSSGYTNGIIRESLHAEPEEDPTEYTRSKRQAEALVALSGLPYLIIRPSIVYGDSISGRYLGRPYGIYQLWTSFEKMLCDKYRPVMHFIAPKEKLQLIHQDAFQASFIAACKSLPDNSFINLVSHAETLPTIRQVTQLWVETCFNPKEVYYHDNIDLVPMDTLDRRQRTWLEFTAVNTDIASHAWDLETTQLDNLISQGLHFVDATLKSTKVCQDLFVANSRRIQNYLAQNADAAIRP